MIEVDTENATKDIEALDIELPVLAPRVQRVYKNLAELDVSRIPRRKVEYRRFSPEQQRQIIFRDIDSDTMSHRTMMGTSFEPNYQSMIGFFTKKLMRDFGWLGTRR